MTTFFRAVVWLVAVLAGQVALARLWPAAPRWIDLHALPVIAFAIGGRQSTGMWVGCAAGLMQDAWFTGGILGLNGFKKTLYGWLLAGLNSRLDLQGAPAHFVAGVAFALFDAALDPALRRLVDREAAAAAPLELAGKAVITGLLVAVVFRIVNRDGNASSRRRR